MNIDTKRYQQGGGFSGQRDEQRKANKKLIGGNTMMNLEHEHV